MSDDDASASSDRSDHERRRKVKVLALVDGIMVEPVGSRDSADDDDSLSAGSATGELGALAAEEEEDGAAAAAAADGPASFCTDSSYGPYDGSAADLRDMAGPDVDGGLVFAVKVLPNDYDGRGGARLKFLEPRDYDASAGTPKARRKMPFPVTADDFYGSIVRTGEPRWRDQLEDYEDEMWDRERRAAANTYSVRLDESPARWLFHGVVNGWPGLPMPLEVMRIEARDPGFFGKRKGFATLWRRDAEGRIDGRDPVVCKPASEERGMQVKVRLRAPQWSAHGWSEASPGFLFWVEGQRVGGAVNPPLTVTYGTDLRSHFERAEGDDPRATRVHMVSHRYATGGMKEETAKDKLTYHSLALIEWDHGDFCSVVEIGFLDGLGGSRCKSNWYVDRDAAETSLYAAFPPEMIRPWKDTMSEIRVHDVPYPGELKACVCAVAVCLCTNDEQISEHLKDGKALGGNLRVRSQPEHPALSKGPCLYRLQFFPLSVHWRN